MSSISPTVGRKIWFWQSKGFGLSAADPKQPFDATIIYVNTDGSVNLNVTDHLGNQTIVCGVVCFDSTGVEDHEQAVPYATWMPYQIGQAKAATAAKNSGVAPSPTLSPPAPAPTDPPAQP